MKLRFLLFTLITFCGLTAMAEEGKKYFEELSTQHPFSQYNYVSPVMLKALGSTMLDQSNYVNLPITGNDLTMIETITMDSNSKKIWEIIKKIKSEKKLETLTTKKMKDNRYDVLASLSKDGNYIENLLVVTQTGGIYVNVVYMEGRIPLDKIRFSLTN